MATDYPKPEVGRYTKEIKALIAANVPAEIIDRARMEFIRGSELYDGFVQASIEAHGCEYSPALKTYKGSK